MSSKVAVVILNYNGKKHLAHFLPSVIENTFEGDIVIADNASTDDSIFFVEKNYAALQVIRMQENTGFSAGYNIALRRVEADYYVLLNSDVEVTPNWLAPLIRLMDSNTNIAACQPKIKSFHHKDTFEHAGAGGGYMDIFGFPFCRGRILGHLEKDNGQYNDTKEVFWASGACMVVRAELYHRFGGLDDDFFAHMEEIDLCWRLKNAGYQIFYCGESEVYHVGGGTLGYKNPRKLYLNFRNSLVMLVKNLPPVLVFPIIFLRMVLDGLAGLHFLSKGSIANFMAVIQSHFYLYRNLFKILKKRNKARHFANTDKHKELFKGSIVWQYFIRKKKVFGEILNF